ncbi:sodium-dependent transporter [Clostridium ganghwense]|uniref:Sodium-dependent transporter n=1 Tax=Clostridium ganghwense TaxID=312089 RepID=A0ABT4CRD5_9CLOT|nr:sodium-dependent transporter [Clostridium ganghwense]MCY6371607.1 sodium-dependent transporter [Clostridium ganghwense]
MKERENFSGKLGFILSCIGSAVGLGNIWMFSWRLGQYGGAAFLIPYCLFVLILGTTGLMGEFALGRSRKKGSFGGIKEIFEEKKLPFGSLFASIPTIGLAGIFVFYTIVVGWILRYFLAIIGGTFNKVDIPAYFTSFAGTSTSIGWHALAVIITASIVIGGVSKGIEKINKIIMPALFIIFVALMVKSLTLPGAAEGIKYLLIPKWSYLQKPITWVMALGQAFFTVSLTGSALVVYGSYLNDEIDIPNSAINTVIFDTMSALLAAFIIIPAAFSFGLDPTAGPALLFITVPSIFKMMPGGQVFGALFFLSIIFAAISSAINMLEAPVEAVMYRLKWTRSKSVLIISILAFILGIPLDLSLEKFGAFSDFITIYLSPLGAILAAVAFFWIFGIGKAREEINKGAVKPLGKWFEPVAKYVFTIVAIVVLILGAVYGGIG